MKDILLDASAKISNLAFFENGMMPDWAVLVNGGSLTAESIQQIEDFLTDAHSGADKHHGMLYIAALPEMGGNAVKVEMVPLNAPHKDMAFKELHEASRDTILRCWGLSPGKAGVQSMGALGGGTNLMAETDSFKFEVVEPIQTRVEYSFNRILRLDFGFEGLLFEFAELDLKEERQNVEMATRAVGGSPFITVNEARAMIGLPILVGEGYDKIPEPKQDTGPYAVGGVRRLHDPEQPVRKPATEEAAEGKKAADK
jgi:capsid portal protein